jgi:hypothetical protein
MLLMAAAVPLVALHRTRAQSQPQANERADKFHRAAKPVRDRYIVVLKHDTPGQQVESITNELLARHGGTAGYVYKNAIKGFSIQLPEAAARALSNDPRVEYVDEDGEVTLATTQSIAPWHLDRIDQHFGLSSSYSFANVNTGARVHVYVVDSGIQNTHTEFRNPNGVTRVVRDADFTVDWNVNNDCLGHGTEVAGLIGGNTFGVAKGATLHAVRIFGCQSWTFASTIIAGVNWVSENHLSPAVMNLSVTTQVSPISGVNYGIEDAVRGAIDHGVTTVIAAGNDNLDANQTSPARVSEAITVGATDRFDNRASFSNFGPMVDLFAPGVDLTSASIIDHNGNGILDDSEPQLVGTSFAAPVVTGIAARFLQTHPDVAPAAVQGAIKNSATANAVINPGDGSPNLLAYSEIHAKLGVTAFIGFIRESDTLRDSGIDLMPGDWMTFTGLGEIWSGVLFTGNNGPQGWNSIDNNAALPLPGSRPFSLLGIFNSQPFYIGLSNGFVHNFASPTRLFLRTNDDLPGNGSGEFHCAIQTWKRLSDVSADFVSQSVPNNLLPGQSFPVSVTMKNVGPTTWTAGDEFKLAIEPDSLTWGVVRVTVPNDVPPGATVTFNFNATAPSAPGNYNMQWRMIHEGAERFGDMTPNLTLTVLSWSNQAQFISQSVKTAMYAGESYTMSITMKNVGNTTWTTGSNYWLGSQNQQDNLTWGLNRVVLPGPVPPGGQVTFTFDVIAPAKGTFNFQWRMVQDGVEWFGPATPNVVVTVKLPPCLRC